MKKFLHVGCGPQYKDSLKGFKDWQEIRFDIDPEVKPDILGSLTDMSAVEDKSVEALYSSHNIEHLYPHEVPIAIAEFYRVLKEDGFVVITCPDLQSVAKEIANGKLIEALYESPMGPISALDILYGHVGAIRGGNTYMAHKCGFTFPVLSGLFREAGFGITFGASIPSEYSIWMICSKNERTQQELNLLASQFLP
jgi:hypothetical protein